MKSRLRKRLMSVVVLMVTFSQICIIPDIARAEETITDIGSEKVISLQKMNVPSKDAEIFESTNLDNSCTKYDATLLYNICRGNKTAEISENDREIYIRQGELVSLFLQLFDISAGEDAIGTAQRVGLIKADDCFTNNGSAATYYNLACLAYNCITYDPTPDDSNSELPVFKTMLENKILDGLGFDGVKSLGNSAMLDTFLYGVKKYPYTVMKGGRSESVDYYYVSYFGSTLLRPYFSQQQWSRDGKSFICSVQHTGDNKQYLYVYNIETQTFRYIDATNTSSGCVMGDDNFVYYARRKQEGSGLFEIWKSPIDGSGDPEHVYTFPGPMWVSMLHITNDGKYLSVEVGRSKESANLYDYPAGTTPILRIDLEDGTHDLAYYGYNYSNTVNHLQINPEYEDLIFFAHETNTDEGYTYTDVQERASLVDVETGKVTHIAPGLVENSDRAILFFTHENWSYNGKHLYITNLGGAGENTPKNGIIRVDKDGTHRRFFYNNLIRGSEYDGWSLGITHSYPSGDDRFFAIDGNWVYLMSAETNQVFPICRIDSFAWRGHPYHAHPVIARHKYIANWGMVDSNGVLGISWYDFTDIDKTKVATGDRYKFGDCVENVRYYETRSYAPELLCDTEEVMFEGKTALHAEEGKNIYLDINEDIVDTVNGSVKISFDYYDNSESPLVLTYTKGVENDNDLCHFENMTKEIARTGTDSWKTGEIIIESGNFEDIGTYGTDFHISGNDGVYVANINAEVADSINSVKANFSSVTQQDGEYIFSGNITRTRNNINKIALFAASYTAEEELIKVDRQVVEFSGDSLADFSMSIPFTGKESAIRFYAWDNNNIIPLSEKIHLASFNLNAVPAANGVKLAWDVVEGAEEYEIYRDGKRIAVTENTYFDDKYFTVPEQLEGDVMKEYTTPHSYVVKCGNKVSKSVSAAVDTSLIKYTTSPTDTIVDFGDAETDEYIAVVTVRATDAEEKGLFSVSVDSYGTMKNVPYSDMKEEIKVFSAFMGRTTGVSYKPQTAEHFSVPAQFVSAANKQDYYSYVFKINACFGESEENNLIFSTDEGLTTKSVAFIKTEHFIN